jgi:uracil-DNA glycosylase
MPRIVLCGEAWGENEDALKTALVGASGIELLNMMAEASLIHLSLLDRAAIEEFWRTRDPRVVLRIWHAHEHEFYRTNVFNFRPNSKNDILALCGTKKETGSLLPPLKQGKYLYPKFESELARLAAELSAERPNLIIALGNTPSWALFSQTAISKIRGTVFACKLVPGLKVLPTYHPAAIFRQYEYRAVTIIDLAKAKREAQFPEIRRPQRQIFVPETLTDLENFYEESIAEAKFIAVDIETSGQQITCIGFSPRSDRALVVPIIDNRRDACSYWKTLEEEVLVWDFIRRVLNHPAPKVFQNGLYDLHFLYRGYGIKVRNCEHDTMLLHHSLQPESPKGLGFLGSVYTDEPAWKLMRERKTNKRDE